MFPGFFCSACFLRSELVGAHRLVNEGSGVLFDLGQADVEFCQSRVVRHGLCQTFTSNLHKHKASTLPLTYVHDEQDVPLNRTENTFNKSQLYTSCLLKQVALFKRLKSVYCFVWNRFFCSYKDCVKVRESDGMLYSYISAMWVNFDPLRCITETQYNVKPCGEVQKDGESDTVCLSRENTQSLHFSTNVHE